MRGTIAIPVNSRKTNVIKNEECLLDKKISIQQMNSKAFNENYGCNKNVWSREYHSF